MKRESKKRRYLLIAIIVIVLALALAYSLSTKVLFSPKLVPSKTEFAQVTRAFSDLPDGTTQVTLQINQNAQAKSIIITENAPVEIKNLVGFGKETSADDGFVKFTQKSNSFSLVVLAPSSQSSTFKYLLSQKTDPKSFSGNWQLSDETTGEIKNA